MFFCCVFRSDTRQLQAHVHNSSDRGSEKNQKHHDRDLHLDGTVLLFRTGQLDGLNLKHRTGGHGSLGGSGDYHMFQHFTTQYFC